jgi:hypothetical protein
MVADRVYGRCFLEGSNGRTSLLYFTAAVPMVGFVHRAADLNSGNPTRIEAYAEARFLKRAETVALAVQLALPRSTHLARLT